MRMFFIDYKLAFIPSKQVSKLVDLGLETSICLLHASGFLTSFLLPSTAHLPIHIGDAEVDSSAVPSSLWHITENLSLTLHTDTMVRNACQWLYFLRRLRKSSLNASILTNFYSGSIKSLVTGCIMVWYRNCSAHSCRE